MKITAFYFSGAGNTAWAVETLNRQFASSGYDSVLYRIDRDISDDKLTKILTSSDLLGFAYPLYGANIPHIMRMFMHRVTTLAHGARTNEKHVFFINTFAYVNGHGVFNARKEFKDVPFKTVGYVNLRLTNTAPSKTKTREQVGEKLPSNLKKKAEDTLNRFIQRLEIGKKTIMGIGPHLLVGILIRRILRDEIKKNHLRMRVNMEKCTACMLCVKSCPVFCIRYTKGSFGFSSACEACMRCYHLCPQAAITNF